MARRPIAFNNSTKTTNSIKKNTIEIGIASDNYASNPGGLTWFNGADSTTQYVIYSDTFSLGMTTLANAKPVCWASGDLTDANVLRMINGLPTRHNQAPFITIDSALAWVAASSTFNMVSGTLDNIVTNGLVLNLDCSQKNSYPGSGVTWYDLGENGNNITLTNGPTFDTANGGSIVFDGSNDYGKNDVPNLPTGNVTTTICAWIYVVSGYGDWQGIAGWGNAGVFSNSALLDMNQGRLAFSTWGYPGAEDLISTYNVPKNTWKYVVGSINNRNIKLYADSVSVLNSSITSTPSVTSTKLRLATTDYPGRLLNTKIASVQIYNRELSQTEITQNFNAQKSKFGL